MSLVTDNEMWASRFPCKNVSLPLKLEENLLASQLLETHIE